MKPIKFYVAALAAMMALVLPLLASAQDATPAQDPLEYDDAAMHYRAPDGAQLVGQMQHPTLSTLSQDPTPIARWVMGTAHQNAKLISIVMESFTGSLDGFESSYANELRAEDESTLVKSKDSVLLQNGMPAMFLDVTQGTGFKTPKIYAYIWIDSQRGVILSVEAMLGTLNADRAKQLLAGATAVRYPGDAP